MNAHQIRTNATNGANPKKRRWRSVVRSCCSTLKAWFSALRVALSGAQTQPMKLSTQTAYILKSHNRSTRLLNRDIDVHHALYDFLRRCRPTMKETIRTNHGSNKFGVSNFHRTLHNSPRSMSLEVLVPRCHTDTATVKVIHIEGSNGIHRSKLLVPASAIIKPRQESDAVATSSAKAH